MGNKKKKNPEKKHIIGKKEFYFNLMSILILIGICLYFGGRSFYYYSKQNGNMKAESQTLNGLLINNNSVISKGDGLYRDSSGYYFKGNVQNNYVSFANRIFRVIRVNDDNTVKVVSDNLVGSFMWGEKSLYENSNLKYWLTDTGSENSGIYYNSFPNPKKFLVKTKYSENILKDDKVLENKKIFDDYITTLSISDYVLANGKSSYLNIDKIFYLLGLNSDKENIYVDEDGSVQSADSLEGYGIRAVMTFKDNLNVKEGDGSKDKPFIIDQGENTNYVDGFVKMGNDTYRIFQENSDGLLKMYLYGYANNQDGEIIRSYSTSTSIFDLNDNKNIANYLNNDYLNSLPYNDKIVDSTFYTGEISEDAGYNYLNIYKNQVVCKVGLLNIFDYISYNELNDYFHMNTTSSVGSIQYNSLSNGLLEEVDVTDEKHIVPVISINKNSITKGTGKIDNPYVME